MSHDGRAYVVGVAIRQKPTTNEQAMEILQNHEVGLPTENFNPSQPRGANGRWSSGTGTFGSKNKAVKAAEKIVGPEIVNMLKSVGVEVIETDREDVARAGGAAYLAAQGKIAVSPTATEWNVVHEIGHAIDSGMTSTKTYAERGFDEKLSNWSGVELKKSIGKDKKKAVPNGPSWEDPVRSWDYAFSSSKEAFAHSFAAHMGFDEKSNNFSLPQAMPATHKAVAKRLQELLGPTANYNPSQPRDSHGRFGAGGSSKVAGGKHETLFAVTKNPETKKWEDSEGNEAPEHVQKAAIPSGKNGWTDVYVNPDPNGDMLVQGLDQKGRLQTRYTSSHDAQTTAAKFGRVTELRKKRAEIFKELDKDAQKPELTDRAECLKVVMQTGIRPGGRDTKAEHKSYGATTLEGRHVKVADDGSVSLKFATGKNKGREEEFPIHDKATAKMLMDRASKAGDDGRIFGNISQQKLREYSLTKDGGGFKTKDHRTAVGTDNAIEVIKSIDPPRNKKDYLAKVNEVGEAVAKTLGNTRPIALKQYIDPTVFLGWKHSAGVM
jgi:DNA topoisomerase-1